MGGATGGGKDSCPQHILEEVQGPFMSRSGGRAAGERRQWGVRPAGGGTEQDTWRDGDDPWTHERPHGGWAGGQAQDCGRTNGLTGGMQLCGVCGGLKWSSIQEQTPRERGLSQSHLGRDKKSRQSKKVKKNYQSQTALKHKNTVKHGKLSK